MSALLLTHGDALHMPLADGSVNTITTSPPYFGLRVYNGLEPTVWPGGAFVPSPGAAPITMQDWTGCLGNEDTADAFVWHTVLWLREAWRVLTYTGTLWLNIGDSYAGGGGGNYGDGKSIKGREGVHNTNIRNRDTWLASNHTQPGNLLLIPARVALAAQADGWIVRQELIWAKQAPMPESVSGWRYEQRRCACMTSRSAPPKQGWAQQNAHASHDHGMDIRHKLDGYGQPDPACPTCAGTGRLDEQVLRKGSWRHTRATESIFMLVKDMGYFANAEAVREPLAIANAQRTTAHYNTAQRYGSNNGGNNGLDALAGRMRDGLHTGRNPRNVVSPPPSNFAGAHFATFPPALIEPLIRASCPERVCTQCGEPHAPVVTRISTQKVKVWHGAGRQNGYPGVGGHYGRTCGWDAQVTLCGLLPTCTCNAPWTPGVCLDPFTGSGTTLLVAHQLCRHAIGLERSPAYITLAHEHLTASTEQLMLVPLPTASPKKAPPAARPQLDFLPNATGGAS